MAKYRHKNRNPFIYADLSRGTSSTLKKIMRAAARGIFVPVVPTEKAKMRHAWYRKQKFWDAMRQQQSASD